MRSRPYIAAALVTTLLVLLLAVRPSAQDKSEAETGASPVYPLAPASPADLVALQEPELEDRSPPAAERSVADLLDGVDLSAPGERERVVTEVRRVEELRQRAAVEQGRALDIPVRVEQPNGSIAELFDFNESGQPLYRITHNSNAAISTGASELQSSTYDLRGTGLTIGMWDGGGARSSHQEFEARMFVQDGAPTADHATHVAGTMAAAGVDSQARGMAPGVIVHSYDWSNDASELISRAAAAPNESGMLAVSNHSYGIASGWGRSDEDPSVYVWFGSGESAASIDGKFGQYNDPARDADAIAYSAPYFLMFRSAGNDRGDNPYSGQTIQLSPLSSTTTEYDAASHPAGDANYREGFDTLGFESVAKNVITIGAVGDAVQNGLRYPDGARMTSFSSWGPTDDGRIKPDIVANGETVYSSRSSSDSAYGSSSGTSMSAPNATGTAALLVDYYRRLFPGEAMRSSTLKALLIHTADDLGNPGPDYKFGWGLLSAGDAAALILDHAEHPLKVRLSEAEITSASGPIVQEFVWDGVSPIKVTIAWTDPAGYSTTSSDLRSPRLRNNLDLKLIGPEGSEFLPYVMPFVGVWTQYSMDAAATTGVNNTDNVEQVLIASPAKAGVYRAIVSFQGQLTNQRQQFSMLISGSANEEPPPPPLSLSGIAPDSGHSGSDAVVELSGSSLASVRSVALRMSGQSEIPGVNLEMLGDRLRCQFDLAGARPGLWDVVIANGVETFALQAGFRVIESLWSENFDGSFTGWTTSTTTTGYDWALTSTASHSPDQSCFAVGPGAKITTSLVSPSVQIPAGATDLQLSFWHQYNLESGGDGARLELSVDGGQWFSIEDAGVGVTVVTGGYSGQISASGPPSGRSAFAGLQAWTGNSNGFLQTVIQLNTSMFGGRSMRARWMLATNSSTSSPGGWYVDSIALTGSLAAAGQPPVITTPPTASSDETVVEGGITYHVVRSTTTILSVAAEDSDSTDSLSYSWSTPDAPSLSFLPNDSLSASQAEVEFQEAGDYAITVRVTDGDGLSASATVYVRVVPTGASLLLEPAIASVQVGARQQFSAVLLDQFANPMEGAASSLTWSITGGGSIDGSGLFTAAVVGDGYSVVASTENGVVEDAQVSVTPAPATVSVGNLVQVYDGSARAPTIRTTPAGLATSITYEGATTPPVDAGSYNIEVRVTDPNYFGSATGTLTVEKASASIIFGSLTAPFTGYPAPVAVTTVPAGLKALVTYDGSGAPPAAVGSYSVQALVDERNYAGALIAVLNVAYINDQGETYDEWISSYSLSFSSLSDGSHASDDPDGDGLPNLAEFYLGADPWDPDSRLMIGATELGANATSLNLAFGPISSFGRYQIQYRSMTSLDWVKASEFQGDQYQAAATVELPVEGSATFYRVVYILPGEVD